MLLVTDGVAHMHLLQNPSKQNQQTLSLRKHGFRSQRSCETQFVHIIVQDIINSLHGAVNRGHKQSNLIIVDFAMASEKVPHRRLLHKLEYYGI